MPKPASPAPRKRTATEGWINVQLDTGPNAKLREMLSDMRPRVSLTALIESAVDREWEEWDRKRLAGKGVAL